MLKRKCPPSQGKNVVEFLEASTLGKHLPPALNAVQASAIYGD